MWHLSVAVCVSLVDDTDRLCHVPGKDRYGIIMGLNYSYCRAYKTVHVHMQWNLSIATIYLWVIIDGGQSHTVIASIMKQPFIQRIWMVTMDSFHCLFLTIAHIYFLLFSPLPCVMSCVDLASRQKVCVKLIPHQRDGLSSTLIGAQTS